MLQIMSSNGTLLFCYKTRLRLKQFITFPHQAFLSLNFCLFRCISRWLKTKCDIVFANQRAKRQPGLFFELQQIQKSKQRNLVVDIWFLVTGWCNETKIGKEIFSYFLTFKKHQLHSLVQRISFTTAFRSDWNFVAFVNLKNVSNFSKVIHVLCTLCFL